MCATCGCGDDDGVRVSGVLTGLGHAHPDEHAHPHDHPHEHPHDHPHEHPHNHSHETAQSRTIVLEQQILAKNDELAGANRQWLGSRSIMAVNLMSSPGSGKTTLLTRTIVESGDRSDTRSIAVIEGDQETLLDAERIRETGVDVVQINTGAGCHLDADMLRTGLARLNPAAGSLVFIENVGNLVCPALFDLGESARVVVMSVTEGADKPLKYPHMFAGADLVVINKADLLPYVDFDVDACIGFIHRIRPRVPCLLVSATTGSGLDLWYEWLAESRS